MSAAALAMIFVESACGRNQSPPTSPAEVKTRRWAKRTINGERLHRMLAVARIKIEFGGFKDGNQ
jgi:hypothetical protein